MAEIAPFCGLRYNLAKIPDLSKVVTPPYDVISPDEQKAHHAASPYNMVHLELGMAAPGDSEEDNPHTRAARSLKKWQEEGALVHDAEPAIYYYEVDYPLPGGDRRKRYGFISLLKLEEFRAGGVRPHEKTFQAVKDERLRLMLACDANLSPVFALYPDPEQVVDRWMEPVMQFGPALHFVDERGMEHKLWPVRDRSIVEQVRDFLLDKSLFIADGHHRYETALNYRNIQRARHPELGPKAHYEYIMVYLANMNQGGLTILPTHRLLRGLEEEALRGFLKKAEAFFNVSSYDADGAGESAWRRDLDAAGARKEATIGYCRRGERSLHLLIARKEEVSSHLRERGFADAVHQLDVVVLDQLILRGFLNLSESFLADHGNITFERGMDESLAQVRSGAFDAGFILNTTRIEQVQEVAGAGLVMPHKSTYFYPKVLSGMAIHHPLTSKDETIWW